jgi:murein DD-endopeptidase MepM/ murein hydrolase activator NlpD
VCLIGIPADFPAGTYEITLCEGAPRWSTTVRIEPAEYPQQQIVFPPAKLPLLATDITEERRVIRAALNRESDKRLWSAAFIWPADGEITSQFGARRNGYHRGVDIAAERGAIVRAPAGATVSVAGDFPVHGKTVVLEHGQGVSTVYCHLDTICVEEDQIVDRSATIGKVGDTGLATAPHLHWGLYVHGVPVDPSEWTLRKY